RPAPPAPPIKYLEAGAKLFNNAQFDLASKYLEAASRYRDQLQPDERAMLDAYLKELAKVKPGTHLAPAGGPVPAPQPVSAAPAVTSAALANPAAAAVPSADSASVAHGLSGPEARQKALWLLRQGKEHLLRGNYDEAQKKVEEARALDVHWGLFDDTP